MRIYIDRGYERCEETNAQKPPYFVVCFPGLRSKGEGRDGLIEGPVGLATLTNALA